MVRLFFPWFSLILLGLCGIALSDFTDAPDSDGSPSLVFDPHQSLVLSRLMSKRVSRRQSDGQCPSSAFTACGQGLPDNFCCPSGQTCLALAANTTSICCPPGRTCRRIGGIRCEVFFYNVTQFPRSTILTLALKSNLPRCGTLCCPFGFSCAADNRTCVMNKDQTLFNTGSTNSLPDTSAPPVVTTVTTAVVATSSATTSASPLASSTAASSGGDDDSSRPNTSGIIAGSVIVAAFSFITLAAVVWVKRGSISRFAKRHKPDGSWPLAREIPPRPPPKPLSMLQIRHSRLEWRSRHPPLKPLSPVELPASPISFKMWGSKRRPKLSIPRPIFERPPTVNPQFQGDFI